MLNEEYAQTEASLSQVSKVCRAMCLATKIIFAVFCTFWIIAAVAMVWSLSSEGFLGSSENNIFNIVLHVVRGAIVAILFVIMIRVLDDAVRGESPFTMKQAERLKRAAVSLVVYAVLGIVLGYCSALLQMGGFSSGFVSTNSSGNVIMPIDFAPFIAAAAVFAFSYVFKYGVLLQELSDDTI